MLYFGLVFGITGGMVAFTRSAHRFDLITVFAAILLLLVPALVGSRLLFVVSHWELYRHHPRRIWRRSEGGAAMYGGLVASFLLSIPLLAYLGISFGAFWDGSTIIILIAMIFTRAGCLLNGCCAGRQTEGRIGLYLPNVNGVWCRRVPTQLLEAGLAAALLLSSIGAWSWLPFDGALFLLNLAVYGIARCGLERTRENIDTVRGVPINRLISLSLVTVSGGTLLSKWL
jgi:phosphatidylglycerol:prolipoprotein diacylglycerol transferase